MIDRIDVGDLLDGFVMGKAVHMADWHHRREQAEFRSAAAWSPATGERSPMSKLSSS